MIEERWNTDDADLTDGRGLEKQAIAADGYGLKQMRDDEHRFFL